MSAPHAASRPRRLPRVGTFLTFPGSNFAAGKKQRLEAEEWGTADNKNQGNRSAGQLRWPADHTGALGWGRFDSGRVYHTKPR